MLIGFMGHDFQHGYTNEGVHSAGLQSFLVRICFLQGDGQRLAVGSVRHGGRCRHACPFVEIAADEQRDVFAGFGECVIRDRIGGQHIAIHHGTPFHLVASAQGGGNVIFVRGLLQRSRGCLLQPVHRGSLQIVNMIGVNTELVEQMLGE